MTTGLIKQNLEDGAWWNLTQGFSSAVSMIGIAWATPINYISKSISMPLCAVVIRSINQGPKALFVNDWQISWMYELKCTTATPHAAELMKKPTIFFGFNWLPGGCREKLQSLGGTWQKLVDSCHLHHRIRISDSDNHHVIRLPQWGNSPFPIELLLNGSWTWMLLPAKSERDLERNTDYYNQLLSISIYCQLVNHSRIHQNVQCI